MTWVLVGVPLAVPGASPARGASLARAPLRCAKGAFGGGLGCGFRCSRE